mgnify:CR=1 FL=1
MTAFDQAWDLAKMPIMQGSVSRNYQGENERRELGENTKEYTGVFDDPVSGEQLPMLVSYRPEKGLLSGSINEPEISIEQAYRNDQERLRRTELQATHHENIRHNPKPWENDTSRWSAKNVKTDDKYQRRGYASALYDMVAYILDRDKSVLVPSSDQTKAGKELWGTEVDIDGEDSPPEKWRIRGDLG